MGVPQSGYQLFKLRKGQAQGWAAPRSQQRPSLKLSIIEANIYDAGLFTIKRLPALQKKENIR
jgi:hypothetical protein